MGSSETRAVFWILAASALSLPTPTSAQTLNVDDARQAAEGLRLRSIGPALMGGRIADVEVHPFDGNTWYVAAGSGGVWKTTNAGVTWTPIFDEQPSYSIGDVTLDPSNPEVVWVGTGENVSGRHVGWGDGVYRSRDGGRTWEHMGLERSEHIGKILVDPETETWSSSRRRDRCGSPGGDRGVYRTTDGGESWTRVLGHRRGHRGHGPGVRPREPRRGLRGGLPAAPPRLGVSWQEVRDRGSTSPPTAAVTWRKVETGLPTGDMGKIGLAVTPADPDAGLRHHRSRRRGARLLPLPGQGGELGASGTPTSPAARVRTTTRRSRRHPRIRTSCTRWTSSSR